MTEETNEIMWKGFPSEIYFDDERTLSSIFYGDVEKEKSDGEIFRALSDECGLIGATGTKKMLKYRYYFKDEESMTRFMVMFL